MSNLMSDTSLLHPKFRGAAIELNKRCRAGYEAGRTKTLFKVFETFRNPLRQEDLLRKGATKAGEYRSAHQFGMAVDMVPYLDAKEATALAERIGERVIPGWNWHSSHDYAFLKRIAEDVGLVMPIGWDLVHVEHPEWRKILDFMDDIRTIE